jgi:hypothetical protein
VVPALLSVHSVGTAQHAIAKIQRVKKVKAEIDACREMYGLSASQFAALSKTNAPTIGGTGTDSGTSRADNSPKQQKQNSEESHLSKQSNSEIECSNQNEDV